MKKSLGWAILICELGLLLFLIPTLAGVSFENLMIGYGIGLAVIAITVLTFYAAHLIGD